MVLEWKICPEKSYSVRLSRTARAICQPKPSAKVFSNITANSRVATACTLEYRLKTIQLARKRKKKGKTVRYIHQSSPNSLRTHGEVVRCFKKLQKNPTTTVLGFQAISCFIGVPEFDLIHGFTIDYMHCILIGTTQKLAGFWLDPKNSNDPYYMAEKNRYILNQRILSIRPPSFINRKPRSLQDKAYFKANEWRSFLLYYLRYSLVGLLPLKYVHSSFRTAFISDLYTFKKENSI